MYKSTRKYQYQICLIKKIRTVEIQFQLKVFQCDFGEFFFFWNVWLNIDYYVNTRNLTAVVTNAVDPYTSLCIFIMFESCGPGAVVYAHWYEQVARVSNTYTKNRQRVIDDSVNFLIVGLEDSHLDKWVLIETSQTFA